MEGSHSGSPSPTIMATCCSWGSGPQTSPPWIHSILWLITRWTQLWQPVTSVPAACWTVPEFAFSVCCMPGKSLVSVLILPLTICILDFCAGIIATHPRASPWPCLCVTGALACLGVREDRRMCFVFSCPILVPWVNWGTRLGCWPQPVQEHCIQCIFPPCRSSEWFCFGCWDALHGQIQAKSLINVPLMASIHILWIILL